MPVNQTESVLRKRVGSYLALAEAIHVNQSEKLIHDFRVASRELIALEPILRVAGAQKKILRQLKKSLRAFSLLRDIQVLQLRFESHPRLQCLLQQQFAQELATLESTFRKIARVKFRTALKVALEEAINVANVAPGEFNQSLLQHWQHRVEKLRFALASLDAAQPKTLHKVRIRFKSVRYLTQFLQQSHLATVPVKKADLKIWQDKLGAIQDQTTALAWLKTQPKTKTLQRQLQHQQQLDCIRFVAESADLLRLIDQLDAHIYKALSHPPA
ncbi:MAG TPA: CHAD domain-containing protein [Pseudomonadales bacterium]|nr:CHAD domain-containing protein [Pseudomonadales bacterium]